MFHHLLPPLNHQGEAELQFQVNCLRGFNLVGLFLFVGWLQFPRKWSRDARIQVRLRYPRFYLSLNFY